MNPYRDEYTLGVCQKFYERYYNDNVQRTLLLGINPGRFGSGTTGISFTDPIRLEQACGIENRFPKKPELSSDFVYRMIAAFGGPEKFYAKYFVSAVSPLGFTRDGKNINYYDETKLQSAVTPFIVDSITRMVKMDLNRNQCYSIGEGKNFEFLKKLNETHGWFKEITPLAHPRFIMQYKRKQLERYIDEYVGLLSDSELNSN